MTSEERSTVAELLAGARGGDPHAMNRLFELCRNYLALIARTLVESRLQSKVDASDVVQQTLLEAHRDFARFQGQTEPEWLAWLRRILTHNAADFVRRYRGTDKRQQRLEVALDNPANSSAPGLAAQLSDGGETPSRQLMRLEREMLIADALTHLSPDHQEVIVLRNLQGLSFDEVAHRLGRSRPAVQMLWMRALRKLQEVLSVEC